MMNEQVIQDICFSKFYSDCMQLLTLLYLDNCVSCDCCEFRNYNSKKVLKEYLK